MADLVRVQWTPGLEPISYAIDKFDWEAVSVEIEIGHGIEETPGTITLKSDELLVSVFPNGSLTFLRPDGSPLHHQEPPVRKGTVWTQRSPLHPEERILRPGRTSRPFQFTTG